MIQSALFQLTYLLLVISLFSTFAFAELQQQPKFHFDFNSHMIPHPEKAHRGGQDAYFNSTVMLAIADGVGGWNNQGVDPSKYSRFLCTSAQRYLEQDQTKYTSDPLLTIKRSQLQNQNIGSATFLVITLHENKLKYCYIGDGGFMVIRKYQKFISIFQYVEQQHSFNFPYQLAMKKYGGDNPEHSICGLLNVQEGDIIVAGSDGLYDNVEFREVLAEVTKAEKDGTLLTALSKKLAEKAIKRGHDGKFNSPFAKRAKEQKINFEGGKLDDTTVIIARVSVRQPIIEQL